MFLSLGKQVLAFERDLQLLKRAQKELASFKKNITYFNENFDQMKKILLPLKVKIDLVLFDLGISRFHYKHAKRGFSFTDTQSLDMRLNPTLSMTAQEIVNSQTEHELAELFYTYGEEDFSRRIARHLVRLRKKQPFQNAAQLAHAIKTAKPKSSSASRKKSIHPATKVFQSPSHRCQSRTDLPSTRTLKRSGSLSAKGKNRSYLVPLLRRSNR